MAYKRGKSKRKAKEKAFRITKSETQDTKSIQYKRKPSKVLGTRKSRGS